MNVNAPVIVAALVNGNDIVEVIDTVVAQGSMSFLSIADDADAQHVASPRLGRARHASITASITPTGTFPFTSAATITGPITLTATNTATYTALSRRRR